MERMLKPTELADETTSARLGSRDGLGAGDHDVAFRFGQRPSAAWTYPFTAKQYARLLILRGRRQDGEFDDDMLRV